LENSRTGIYNKAVALYKEQKYKEALKNFLSIDYSKKENFDFYLYYNI
jgi:TolA-binding protein